MRHGLVGKQRSAAPKMAKKKAGPRLPAFSRGASSANPDRVPGRKANRSGGSLRDKATIKRLKLYTGGKVKRDKQGVVVEGDLARRDRAGNAEITGATGRARRPALVRQHADHQTGRTGQVPPRAARGAARPLLRRAPPEARADGPGRGALGRAARETKEGGAPAAEPFGRSGTARKRVRGAADSLEALAAKARRAADACDARHGGGADARARSSEQAKILERESTDATGRDLFAKGQSRRIWAELYKVLDCSDVVLHVVDARDPPGTTCARVVSHLKTQATHKHLVFVLNKCDLVPNWSVRRWIAVLGETAPTLAFRASQTKPFGKGALIDVLRQFAHLKSDAKQISCGVVGYPNVGKSSVINALRAKAVCKVAPVPGETKIWQYVALTKRVNLIDCPGVVYNDDDNDEAAAVLKGVVRAERLPDPAVYIASLLRRCDPQHIVRTYDVPFDGLAGVSEQEDHAQSMAFVDALARKSGRLRKGGEADAHTVAVQLINDWQRGKIPHFVAPPEDPSRRPSGEGK